MVLLVASTAEDFEVGQILTSEGVVMTVMNLKFGNSTASFASKASVLDLGCSQFEPVVGFQVSAVVHVNSFGMQRASTQATLPLPSFA